MLQQKLTAIRENRAKSRTLPAGVAPSTSSSDFKLPSTTAKPPAKAWDTYLSSESRRWKHSNLKAAAKLVSEQRTISLGTGRPNPEFYPWSSIEYSVASPNSESTTVASYRGDTAYDLDVALNYGAATGSPQLLRFFTEHVEMIHDPPYADWDCCLTASTTSAMEIILRILCDPGDWILTEAFSYPGTTSLARSLGLRIAPVAMDSEGLVPEELDSVLRSWSSEDGPKPKILYTIPTGHNPTGATQGEQRRRAIYNIAELHDLHIIEDDPYLYLNMDAEAFTLDEYVRSLPISYVKLDRSGRVLRLDTTSKILAPGLRCGWMTGCAQMIAKFIGYTDLSVIAPSGPSQVMLYKLLDETWGHQGFLAWLCDLSRRYKQRRDLMVDACRSVLPTSICSFDLPSHGMFVWVRVNCSKLVVAGGQTAKPCTAAEIEERIYSCARDNGVLISRGSWFAARSDAVEKVCIRLTFAASACQDLAHAVQLFGDALKEVFGIPSS